VVSVSSCSASSSTSSARISTASARSNIDTHYPILSTCTNIESGTNNGGTSWVRPSLMITSGTITVGGVAFLLMAIHELIHGFFFWVLTRSKPVFAIRLFYWNASSTKLVHSHPPIYDHCLRSACNHRRCGDSAHAAGSRKLGFVNRDYGGFKYWWVYGRSLSFHSPFQVIANESRERHRRCNYLLWTTITLTVPGSYLDLECCNQDRLPDTVKLRRSDSCSECIFDLLL